ncbi:Mu transposase C-terminal domain-containing protein [Agrobacterium sp. Azo12]|uniref:Mu transposase C-terminal domain-containing protein n=1 Tax=Agrobacterium sp. Azo12 TaxID=3031129 RepID=UPI0023D7CBE1|nr:Mu transposase C-terminal domain-containing protein [Agrobacterium sp. Azo12]MDO5897905.1 Mu transposase C-terminal domain-containing protein [Agrobacterium sp. Azo12]
MNMMLRHRHLHAPDAHETKLYDFHRGDRVEYKHAVYNWLSTTNSGYWFQRTDDNLPPEFYTFEEVSRAFQQKRDPMGYLPHRRRPENETVSGGTELLSNLLPDEQQDVLFKHAWCLRFLKTEDDTKDLEMALRVTRSEAKLTKYLNDTQEALQKASDEAHKAAGRTHRTAPKLHAPPAPRTLRRWVETLEKSNFDPVALCNDNSARRRRDHFTPEELKYINEYVWMYASPDRLPIKELHRLLSRAIEADNAKREQKNAEMGAQVLAKLRVPDIDTFSARIRKLPSSHVDLGQHGADYATAKYRSIMSGIDVLRPLEQIQLDECWIDLQTLLIQAEEWENLSPKERKLVARVRLYVTAAKDVATKSIVGMRIHHTSPNTASAVSTLEMVTRDKTELAKSIGCETPWDQHGVFGEVSLDSASWNASNEVRIAVNDLGGILFQPKSGDAAARGTLERFFRTMNRQALLFFTGRTWGSPAEKGDYDAEGEASVVFHQAAELLMRFVVDVFHNTPHAGLNGETPRQAWERLNKFYKPAPPLSSRLRRNIFGITIRRKISRSGIRVLGIQYSSSKLQKLFREDDLEVEVRIDRFDLGAISVRHPEGWLTVPAVHDDLIGMSIWKWLAFNDRLRLTNRKNVEVSQAIVNRTKEWLRDQAQMARAEAELGSAILTERDIMRFEKKVAYSIDIVEETRANENAIPEEVDVATTIRNWDMYGIRQDPKVEQAPEPAPLRPSTSSRLNTLNPDFNR